MPSDLKIHHEVTIDTDDQQQDVNSKSDVIIKKECKEDVKEEFIVP